MLDLLHPPNGYYLPSWYVTLSIQYRSLANDNEGVFGNNIGLNATTAMQVPDTQVPKLVLGSKLAFMNWIWYLCYVWCLKGVLLCLYNKLTYVPLFTV